MPLSAEQQRERRAVKRAAEEAAGVFRRRRGGRLAAGHVWDEQTGTAVPQAPCMVDGDSAEEGESVPPTARLAVPHSDGYWTVTCSTTLNSVQPRRCSQRARTAVLRVSLRWTFVKHACGKLWTLVSTSETQTRINN